MSGNVLPIVGLNVRDAPTLSYPPKPVTLPKQAGHQSIFFFFPFLGLLPRHVEVPRPGV